jgi:carboxypeptidase Taq
MPKTRTSKAGPSKTNTSKAKASKKPAAKKAASASRGRQPSRPSPDPDLKELKQRLLEISDVAAAGAVLGWDHATYMPRGGADARARQGATLSRIAHEKATDPALGRLLDRLAAHGEALPYDSDDASLIRVTRRDFERAIKVPAGYVARASALASASYDAWTRARPANDFATMRPFLEQALDLSREYAKFFAPYKHIADPLIDGADEGMTAALVRALFAALREKLVALVRAIADQPLADDACLRGPFTESEQLAFGLAVVKHYGYDLDRGRLDKTHHPFCTKFSSGDVRITTRVNETDLGDALFSTLHEAGHALYEQGVSPALEGTPLGWGTSAGVHESQSRLWENVVGRGRGFWQHFYPQLQRVFPDRLGPVPLDAFYRAINKVQRSLIRTDADEVTYNLHVMMRFELELDMLEGRLQVKDLPAAWRARIQSDLGVEPPDDRDGCLQDVHWYSGAIGGSFQGYTIGNILSAQFFAAAVKANPEIPKEIAAGRFATLHNWLRTHLYQHGRKFTPNEIVERATGSAINVQPYLDYLHRKYGELYRLPAQTH